MVKSNVVYWPHVQEFFGSKAVVGEFFSAIFFAKLQLSSCENFDMISGENDEVWNPSLCTLEKHVDLEGKKVFTGRKFVRFIGDTILLLHIKTWNKLGYSVAIQPSKD